MATAPSPDVVLDPLRGLPRPIEEWVTTFHLAIVVLDPYTYESSWLIPTAGRILETYQGADCRVAWLVAADKERATSFLGPWAESILTFVDPDRTVIRSLGLERVPAFVHIDHALGVAGVAEGWDPPAWRRVAEGLATVMSWSKPIIPAAGDPPPYEGTPALP